MKRIMFLLFITISVFIIYNFLSSVYRLLHKKDVIIQTQTELRKVQKENIDLKKALVQVKNPQFVDEQAHDKLFLVKPGENTVIIPKSLLPTLTIAKTAVSSKPNWKKWLDLFWH